MAKTVFDVLKEKLEADKKQAIEFLVSAGAKDFSQYKEMELEELQLLMR